MRVTRLDVNTTEVEVEDGTLVLLMPVPIPRVVAGLYRLDPLERTSITFEEKVYQIVKLACGEDGKHYAVPEDFLKVVPLIHHRLRFYERLDAKSQGWAMAFKHILNLPWWKRLFLRRFV